MCINGIKNKIELLYLSLVDNIVYVKKFLVKHVSLFLKSYLCFFFCNILLTLLLSEV